MPGIEVPLVLNKSVNWRACERVYLASSVTLPQFKVNPRGCSLGTIPVSSDLIDALKSCRIPVKLDPVGEIKLPLIWIDFAMLYCYSEPELDEVYIDIPNLNRLVNDVLGEDAPRNCELGVRVDVKTMTCHQNEYYMEPLFSSQFFSTRKGTSYALKMKMISSFKAQTIFDAWRDPDVNWQSTVSFTLFFEPGVQDFTGLIDSNTTILGEKLFSDAVIIAKDGAEIECHRNILAAQSSFFLGAFQTDMVEGQTRKVKLPGMSEECVQALLDFMYSRATHVPRENSEVCVQLLEAGHKYDILDLQRDMEEILLNMVADLNADVALELFLFSKTAGLDELKTKAMQAMKLKYKDLKVLPRFQELFKKNLDTAMELVDFFATANSPQGCNCEDMVQDDDSDSDQGGEEVIEID